MIHILWCTIRPLNFPNWHRGWMDRSKDPSQIKTHVLVSTEEEKKFLEIYFLKSGFENQIHVYNPPYRGVALPSYNLSSTLTGEDDDIVVFASDDFVPPQMWDVYLGEHLTSCGALIVNDGYQKLDFSNMEHPVVSIPIMTYSCLERLGKIIYHPAYRHLYSDAELYLNLKELNLLNDIRTGNDPIFEHLHWSNGRREGDSNDKLYYSHMQQDKKTWEGRQKLTLEQRLKVYESYKS